MAGPRTSLTPPPLSPTPQKLEAECLRGHFPTHLLFPHRQKKFRLRQGCLCEMCFIILSLASVQKCPNFIFTHALGAKISKRENAKWLETGNVTARFGNEQKT